MSELKCIFKIQPGKRHPVCAPKVGRSYRARAIALCITAFLCAGAGPGALTAQVASEPLKKLPPAESRTLFERLSPERTGINVVTRFPSDGSIEALQDQRSGSGTCIGDYDGDGWPDIYISNYKAGNRLYRNLGGWRFQDVTAAAGVTGEGRWCGGVTFVDIDNDGDLDLFVCVFNQPNLVYVNQGDGTFRDEAKSRGLDYTGASTMMAFADYDRDGDLDGYLVTARLSLDSSHGLPRSASDALRRGAIRMDSKGRIQIPSAFADLFGTLPKPNGRSELIIAGQPDPLYRNDGRGYFQEISAQVGINGRDIGLAATWWDYNDDGFPDIYVSNDYKGPDRLYRNNHGATFQEVAGSSLPAVPYASMGSDLADVNNDGLLDFFATDMAGSTHAREVMSYSDLGRDLWFLQTAHPRQYRRNMLYLATGTEHLLEAGRLAGLASTDWTWSPKFADLDNDGWIDLFVANGMSRDFVNRDMSNRAQATGESVWRESPVLLQSNFAFRNLGDLRFDDVSKAWGLAFLSASYGAAFADLDRDGALDLVVNNFDEAPAVLRNTERSRSGLLIRLKGRASNAWGVGAKVVLESPLGRQVRYLTLAQGFMSANEPLVHFGCDQTRTIPSLTVFWPGGAVQVEHNLPTDRLHTLTEPLPPPAAAITTNASLPMFQRSELFTTITHREAEFDDFARQQLLPFQLSRSGPALAVGDVDRDQQEDFYLSGAAGAGGLLFIRQKNGGFTRRPQPAFDEDARCEDMGALFLDADQDGDLDLYVVSGGVENVAEPRWMQNRLYLNNGKGDFTRAPSGVVPDGRGPGSVVCAADFDRDGDLDLFVGGGSVPGRYPEAAASRLFRNDGGRFTEVTAPLAPDLSRAGLVTSALWSDLDNDGWIDLLLTRQWGPVMLFMNKAGRFENSTRQAGLETLTGLWNSIAGGDLDQDGDIDYVVGNLGLNTTYRATPEHPALLYHGNLQGRGELDLLEGKYEGQNLFPVRDKSLLSEALPALFKGVATFAEFGSITIPALLARTESNDVARLDAACLESGVLVNDAGKFQFKALPRLAQIAPAFGLAVTDVDGDGFPDLYMAHNFSWARPETGRMNGGLSLLLKGHRDLTFLPLSATASGLMAPGDGRALAVIDFNSDGKPDFLVAQNDSALLGFINNGRSAGRMMAVHLQGKPANREAVGARVQVEGSDGSRQTAEIYAGSGYLSQSSSSLYFGLPAQRKCTGITVRWPDGSMTTNHPDPAASKVVIRQTN